MPVVSSMSSVKDLLGFLIKAGSLLVSVIAVCWPEGNRGSIYSQTVCGGETMDLALELCSGEKFYITIGILSWLNQI